MRPSPFGLSSRPARSLEDVAAQKGMTAFEVVGGLIEATPSLTPGEQAELLGAVLEDARRSPPAGGSRQASPPARQAPARAPARTGGTSAGASRGSSPSRPAGRSGGSFDFSRLFSGVQQGLSLFSQGAQAVSQFATMFGGNSGTARDISRVAGQIAQGTGAAGTMMQALRGGQVPAMPGPQPAAPMAPPQGAPIPGVAPGMQPAGAPAAGGGGLDATALLSMLMSNPQVQQLLRSAVAYGPSAAPEMELSIPGIQEPSVVALPIQDVVGTIGSLAQRSLLELESFARESDSFVPEYFVGEYGETLVDPGDPSARATLALHVIRLHGEAERFGELGEGETDESGLWASEGGLAEWEDL